MDTLCPDLTSATLPLDAVRSDATATILGALDSVGRTQYFVVERDLHTLLFLCTTVDEIRQHEVSSIGYLDQDIAVDNFNSACASLTFLIRPTPPSVAAVANHIKVVRSRHPNLPVTIFALPAVTSLIEVHLTATGCYNNVDVRSLPADVAVLDSDVLLAAFNPMWCRHVLVDKDSTSIHNAALALARLQLDALGLFPAVVAVGPHAEKIVKLSASMVGSAAHNAASLRGGGAGDSIAASSAPPQCAAAVLIDRTVDRVTPLLHQLTYEGLVSDVYGMSDLNTVSSSAIKNGPTRDDGSGGVIPFNSSDVLLAQLRDLNFSSVGAFLEAKSKDLAAVLEPLTAEKFKTLAELNEYAQFLAPKRREKHSLDRHVTISEHLSNIVFGHEFRIAIGNQMGLLEGYPPKNPMTLVEDSIDDLPGKPCETDPESLRGYRRALRLACLISQTTSVKKKSHELFTAACAQVAGFQSVLSLQNLEEAGFYHPVSTKWYSSVAKALRLFVPDVDEANPQDAAFAYSGYTPISVRVNERIVAAIGAYHKQLVNGAAPTAARSVLDGTVAELAKILDTPVHVDFRPSVAEVAAVSRPRDLFTFYAGGITHGEIAALRWLSAGKWQTGWKSGDDADSFDLTIGATSILSGDRLIEQMTEDVLSRKRKAEDMDTSTESGGKKRGLFGRKK